MKEKTEMKEFEFRFPCPFYNFCRKNEETQKLCGRQMRAFVFQNKGETDYEWRAFSDFCDEDKYVPRDKILEALNSYLAQNRKVVPDVMVYLKQKPIAVLF